MNAQMNSVTFPSALASSKRFLLYGILGKVTSGVRDVLLPRFRDVLEVQEVDGLRVAVCPIHPHQQYDAAGKERLQEFADILSELHRVVDILPFRFGTFIAADELQKYLEPMREPILSGLERIAGCTEINLRWAVPTADLLSESTPSSALERSPKTGFEYLRSKRQAKLRDQYLESLVIETANGVRRVWGNDCVATQSSIRSMRILSPDQVGEQTYSIARVDLLVRRDAQSQIMRSASTLLFRAAKPTVVSGPWPPYSFVTMSAEDANTNAIVVPSCGKQALLEAKA